jgi:hypothetical protein
MNLAKRVDQLEKICCPAPDPKEERRAAELMEAIKAGRARVRQYRLANGEPVDDEPDKEYSEIPLLQNGKLDLAAAINAGAARARRRAENGSALTAGGA